MGFDATFKRYFAAVVCLLVAIAAYFQAAGLGQLVVSSLALDPSSTPVVGPGMRPVAAAPPAAPEHATNADAILGRNPFDSVTGPLDGKPIDPLPAPTSNPEDLTRDPYEDPFCDTAKAMLIVTSDDPEWSFASLAGPDGKTQLRRKGDEINGQTVFFVGDLRPDERRQTDRRDLWDRVWLTSGGSRCQLAVGGKAPAKSAAPKAAEKDDKPKAGNGKVPAEISSKIHKIRDRKSVV
jgi:general secretion pathway protein C